MWTRAAAHCVFLTRSGRAADLVARLAERARIHVHTAASLAHARQLLASLNARVLLTEAEYLDGTWKDALEAVRHNLPGVRLVLALAEFDGATWVEAIKRGVYDVVAPPYDAERFTRVLWSACSLEMADPPSETAVAGWLRRLRRKSVA